jgi:hypothetical protein
MLVSWPGAVMVCESTWVMVWFTVVGEISAFVKAVLLLVQK